jgi:hypothetical protein
MFEAAHAPWLAPALQLVGSAVGVVLLVGYTHLLWGRRPHARLTADVALERFRDDYPDERPIAALVLEDGLTALVQIPTPDGLGVVSAHGAGWTTRVLHPADVATVKRDGSSLRLKLRDFAQPALRLRFASAHDEESWLKRLAPMEAAWGIAP